MTAARSLKVDLESTPYYHCMVRCVRRSFLCGVDDHTGKNYDHRKQWIVSRLKQLASIFSIQVCAYAVMSNHYHVVLHIDVEQARLWTKRDIFQRWKALFPRDADKYAGYINTSFQQEELDTKFDQWRERLSSISWFMRCLNEPIARNSNHEDGCTGRFWEGRFKSQALLDDGALLSAMVYVDLNPIRASLAQSPESSDFTSIQERIIYLSRQMKPSLKKEEIDKLNQPQSLMPFSVMNSSPKKQGRQTINFALTDYIHLVECTGKVLRGDKRGAIPSDLIPFMDRLNLNHEQWVTLIHDFESKFKAAAGAYVYLLNFGQQRNRPLKGRAASKVHYKLCG